MTLPYIGSSLQMNSQHKKEVLYIVGIVHINLSKIRVKVKAAKKTKWIAERAAISFCDDSQSTSPAECFSFFMVSFEPGGEAWTLAAHHPFAVRER